MDRRRKWTDIVLPSVVLIVFLAVRHMHRMDGTVDGADDEGGIATSATCTPASFKVRGINPSKPTITAALPDATSGCNVAE
jgi:hypothetical protein